MRLIKGAVGDKALTCFNVLSNEKEVYIRGFLLMPWHDVLGGHDGNSKQSGG